MKENVNIWKYEVGIKAITAILYVCENVECTRLYLKKFEDILAHNQR